MEANQIIVDARGLVCPYVAVKTKRVILEASAASVITVICTDPLAAIDLPVLAIALGRPYSVGPDLDGHFEVEIGAGQADRPSADVWPVTSVD